MGNFPDKFFFNNNYFDQNFPPQENSPCRCYSLSVHVNCLSDEVQLPLQRPMAVKKIGKNSSGLIISASRSRHARVPIKTCSRF